MSKLEKFKLKLLLSITQHLAEDVRTSDLEFIAWVILKGKRKRIQCLLENRNVALKFEINWKEKVMKIFFHILILASINLHSLKIFLWAFKSRLLNCSINIYQNHNTIIY